MKIQRIEIELHKDRASEMLIPYVDGHIHRELFEFLVFRFHWPKRIDPGMKVVSGSSLRNIAYDLKQMLEGLAANKLELAKISYEHLQLLLNAQQHKYAWTNNTYNTKYRRCREFFDFLSMRGISHKVIFPARREATRHAVETDYDLGERRKSITYRRDDGMKRTELFDSYTGHVISMKTYGELYRRLEAIDPVYAVMAQVMMQTCLRISNACQIPLSSNRLNPKWLLWPEFRAMEYEFLKFNHVAKGAKAAWCYVWPTTIQAIYEDYVVPFFQVRKHLYTEKYCHRKNASLWQGRVLLPEKILWLIASGTPVKPYMVERAFRQTGLGIVPHDLRHTGATHLLWNYCQLKGIDPGECQNFRVQGGLVIKQPDARSDQRRG